MLSSFKCLLVTVCTFGLCTAQAQTPQPTQAVPAQQPAQSGLTLHSKARIVVVDVVVTDNHQNAIHNLKVSDFTVLEKNTPQPIKNFEEHAGLSPAQVAALPPPPPMSPGIFSNYSPVPAGGAVNVLLIDALNTPMTDQTFIRNQLKDYLNSTAVGTRIAIFGLNNRLILLQGFTSNLALLKEVINRKNPRLSPLAADAVGGVAPPAVSSEVLQNTNSVTSAVTARIQLFEAQTQAFRQTHQSLATLEAFGQIARYLSGIPGRKNLIWFSESFPILTAPNGSLVADQSGITDPFHAMVDVDQEFRDTINLLAAGQVSIYPVDARGVVASPNLDPANPDVQNVRRPGNFAHDEATFSRALTDDRSTMTVLAEQTGGRAFMNSNDLSQSVAKAIEAGSNYYTLIYSPTDTNWNGDFRKIQVKLQQRGLNLSYRRGYYADNPDKHGQKQALIATRSAKASPALDALHAAMMYGSPEPSQIIFKVRIVPASAGSEDTLAAKNTIDPAGKVKGPYRRYAVDFAADPRAIQFDISPQGNHQDTIQFVTCVYDGDGKLINIVDDNANADIPPAAFLEVLRHGIPWHQEISVPLKGNFYIRAGVHDLAGNRVGAVELPVAGIKNLPPVAASASPTNPPPQLMKRPDSPQ